jgi:hypothetical protein
VAQARPKIRNDRAYDCTAISAGVPGAARASEQAAAAGTCINGSDDEGDGLIDGYTGRGRRRHRCGQQLRQWHR